METLPLIFISLLGLCAGSFAYAMTLRMHDGRDWVKGRSECDMCQKDLKWYDLAPLFSWLSTRGTCRYCKKPMGKAYPVIELATALLFGLSYALWPYGFTRIGMLVFGVWLVMVTLLVSLVIFDKKWYLLPDKIVFTLIGIAAASKLIQVAYFQDTDRLIGVAGGIFVGWGVFFFLHTISSGKYIGGGDVKYGLFFGVLLASPFKSLLVICIGSLIGTLVVLPSVLSKKIKMTSQVPFGPSLIAATIIVYIFGDKIVEFLTTFYLFP